MTPFSMKVFKIVCFHKNLELKGKIDLFNFMILSRFCKKQKYILCGSSLNVDC